MAQEQEALSAEHKAILDNPDFRDLARRKNTISVVLTAVTLIFYFGFVFLLAFNKAVLAKFVAPSITLGIPVGIGVIVVSWILTGIYVRWANGPYDDMVARVKKKLEE